MNLKVATARWMGSIEELEPGSLFIHDGKIAVKMNQDHFSFEPCNCVVIGTGDNLYDFKVDEKTFNKTIVTKILIYEDQNVNTVELIKESIYLCADGDIRRLDEIEDDFLSYSVPIGNSGSQLGWRELGRTKRYQVESDFINGQIISEDEIE